MRALLINTFIRNRRSQTRWLLQQVTRNYSHWETRSGHFASLSRQSSGCSLQLTAVCTGLIFISSQTFDYIYHSFFVFFVSQPLVRNSLQKKNVFSFCRWRIYGEKCDRNASRNAVTGSSMSWRSPLASTVWTPSPQGQLPFLGEGYALKCHYNKFTNCSHSLRVLFKGFQAETFGAGGLCFCSEVFHLRFPMLLIPALFL